MDRTLTDHPHTTHRRSWRLRLQFEPRDLWVGVFWRTEQVTAGRLTTWWICVVPCLPIVVTRVTR